MAGRPKMTEQEKAAAKAAREAAAAGAPEAADRAEARANGKKPPQAAKAAPTPSANTDDLDREEAALFRHHLPLVKAAKEALNSANANLRNLYKKAKAEGNFTKADFDTAFALETAEKEARERAKIARQLKIAKIMGSSLGAQLDMFLEPDRTPASDIAFGEGERDAQDNKPAKPKYDPSTEQYRRYMEGFHGVSAKRVTEGIGKLDPDAAKLAEKEAKEKAKVDQQRAQDAAAFGDDEVDEGEAETEQPPAPASSSGVPMTRAQFKAQQEAKKAREAAGN